MIQLKQITLSRSHKQLLVNADITIHVRQKVGLIGRNGSGKTSLMMMLQGEIGSDDGTFSTGKQKIAYLQQDIPQDSTPAMEYVLYGDSIYNQLDVDLKTAEQKHDGMLIAELHMKMAEVDAYSMPSKAAKIMHGLGFSTAELKKPLNAFSGGWQMRLNLARLLMTRADILLLDEPTNHLDMEAIVWLENWLKECEQTIVLISHDRDFIDNVVTHIAHLHSQQLKLYKGDYSQFEIQRSEQLAVQQASQAKASAKRAHLQSYVDRFRYKASKAKQAQSRIKMLAKMEETLPMQMDNPFHFEFKNTLSAGNPMLTLDQVSLGYDDKLVLKNINCSLRDGDRIGLIGPNGAGKSTLIKLLANKIEVKSGTVHGSNKIKMGYFAQHQLELLDAKSNPLNHLQLIDKHITEGKARQYLGSFNFSNDDVFRNVGSFSGGEKARLVLALIIWLAPNLLLLDEPTNHLDLEMREALNLALQNYQGALILVSHDRHLLNCVTNELWLVANGKVQLFEGDLNDYQRWVIEQAKEAEAPKVKSEKKPSQKKNLNAQKEKLEKELIKLEEELAKIDLRLTDSDLYLPENKTELDEITQKRDQLKRKIHAKEEQLLKLYG